MAEELDFIKENYKNTNIPWSIDRRSCDWDYIKIKVIGAVAVLD